MYFFGGKFSVTCLILPFFLQKRVHYKGTKLKMHPDECNEHKNVKIQELGAEKFEDKRENFYKFFIFHFIFRSVSETI